MYHHASSSSSPLKSSRVGCSPAAVSCIRVIRIIYDITFTDCLHAVFLSGCFHRFYNLLLLHKCLPPQLPVYRPGSNPDQCAPDIPFGSSGYSSAPELRSNVPDHKVAVRRIVSVSSSIFSRSGRVASPRLMRVTRLYSCWPPSRHGVHFPHDSPRKKSKLFRTISTIQLLSSMTESYRSQDVRRMPKLYQYPVSYRSDLH